jgi:glycogen synthase
VLHFPTICNCPADEVVGILNAMDPAGTWAGAGISADEAIRRKTEAKLAVQQRMGLAVGEQYELAIFLGRLTHQKGVDIIAQAAPQVLARHPKLQLLVLGPLGDVAGAEAQESLGMLALDYPGRLVAPANHYVSGDEKELVLAAADFCLCPSRYAQPTRHFLTCTAFTGASLLLPPCLLPARVAVYFPAR